MAAFLFSACGELCNGVSEVCSHVCTKPCQLCGKLCDGFCDGLENCCSFLGEGLSNGCEAFWRSIGELYRTPFSIYVTVAVIFNLPSVYYGMMQLTDLDCKGSQWLCVNAILCLLNAAAAFYMAVAVTRDEPLYSSEQIPMVAARERPSSLFGRAGHMFCYDPWIAAYILVLIAFLVWLWMGVIWTLDGRAAEGCNGDTVGGTIALTLGLGWAFFVFGIGALLIGMCWAYCNDYSTPPEPVVPSSTAPSYGATTGTVPVTATATPLVGAQTGIATATATPIAKKE
ncbi:expressed unknown protein [Seminavis robusta]|uniref:Uncharacterized protein n=1 Tax=Seminavis robusta TaxID=568900 RepID=A0A9N8DYI0_9STRA|nr:expressed unknown protein [Seminavis robusta]|eukprot:Sro391_g133100.1 n/a (285) ;mRNA; r:35978-36832